MKKIRNVFTLPCRREYLVTNSGLINCQLSGTLLTVMKEIESKLRRKSSRICDVKCKTSECNMNKYIQAFPIKTERKRFLGRITKYRNSNFIENMCR